MGTHANATASLGQTLREATRDIGVDVLSLGGTKNGIMGGEAVVFFNRSPGHGFPLPTKAGDETRVEDATDRGAV